MKKEIKFYLNNVELAFFSLSYGLLTYMLLNLCRFVYRLIRTKYLGD